MIGLRQERERKGRWGGGERGGRGQGLGLQALSTLA